MKRLYHCYVPYPISELIFSSLKATPVPYTTAIFYIGLHSTHVTVSDGKCSVLSIFLSAYYAKYLSTTYIPVPDPIGRNTTSNLFGSAIYGFLISFDLASTFKSK